LAAERRLDAMIVPSAANELFSLQEDSVSCVNSLPYLSAHVLPKTPNSRNVYINFILHAFAT